MKNNSLINKTVWHKGFCAEVKVTKEYVAEGIPMALIKLGDAKVPVSCLQRDLVVFGEVQSNGYHN